MKFILRIYNPKNTDEYYDINEHKDEKMWLCNENGEGGEFKAHLFYEAVDKFFKENF